MKKDKKGFITEFKEFIMRGNVLDMAIGVIIATAFGKITTSLVNDMFMPFLGYIIGDMDLTKYNITLAPATADTEAVVLGLGTFISTIIDFLLVALIIFIMIKVFAKTKEIAEKKLLKKQEEEPAPEAPPAPTTEELLAEILAELRNGNK